MVTTSSPTPSSIAAAEPSDDRAFAKKLIDGLPKTVTLADIHHHIGVAMLVQERTRLADEAFAMGIDEAVKAGKLLTSDQVRREIESWSK